MKGTRATQESIVAVKAATARLREGRERLIIDSFKRPEGEMSQKVSNWRNDVEVLRRELEGHRDFIAQLRSGKDTGSTTKDRGLVFREALHRILDKLNSNMKALINLLRKVMSLPRQGEFGQSHVDTWESVLQKLQIDLAQVSITGMREGPEEAISLIFQAFEVRDNLFSQALQALLHKKTVLWMDLGIGSEEFVKNEVFEATKRAIDSFNEQGYIPSRVEYVHPRLETGLPTIRDTSSGVPEVVHSMTSFAEGFQDMTAMIEKNFQLSVGATQVSKKTNPAVSTLREEIEAAYLKCTKLEEDNQNLKTLLRSPDRREWVLLNREVDTLKEELEFANRNIQRLTADKHILGSENVMLKKTAEDLTLKLAQMKENLYPRLEEIEKLYGEIVAELKSIRQDSELLPVLFRNEAQVKFAMRDEMQQAQEQLKLAEEIKDREVARASKLEEERNRKERIALQAIAARNSIEIDLKVHQKRVGELEAAIKHSEASYTQMKQETERYKTEHSELQTHVFVLNNRINELEEHKKTLLEQIKSLGSASKVHHMHRRLHPPEESPTKE